MPIYEYECRGCGHQFEQLVLPSLPAPACPKCESRELAQLLSLCAVSSETTRKLSMRAARKRNKTLGREKAHEEHKEFHKHRDH